MAKLLVSVRDAGEAIDALAGGADIIDIKEPHRGSLGRADQAAVLAIRRIVDRQVPLSMACGELLDWDPLDWDPLDWDPLDWDPLDWDPTSPDPPLSFAKIGLSQCQDCARGNSPRETPWCARWRQWMETLPAGTNPIAVVYADATEARAPAPLEVIWQSQQLGCQGVLVDTFHKHSAPSLLQRHPPREVERWITAARDGHQFIALAGSLTIDSLPDIVRLGADIVAVRGAACADQRTGQICRQKVRRLADALSLSVRDT